MRRSARRFVLGEASSALDAKGSKHVKLQRDFEQLVRGIAELRAEGHAAVGYLLVMTEKVRRRVQGWCRDHPVEVLLAELSADDWRALEHEKEINREFKDSRADLGQALGEAELERQIKNLYPGVHVCTTPSPLNKNWDFFGEI